MDKQKILQADYLDIVFDNRNKSYGSYDLRIKYPDRARRAVLGVLLCAGILCAVPVIASNFGTKPDQQAPVISCPVITEVNMIHQPRPTPKPQPAMHQANSKAAPKVAATIAHTEPRIVENNIVKNETEPVPDNTDKIAGTKNSNGDPGGKVADTGQPHGQGDEPFNDTKEPSANSGIVDIPDVMPEFDGDVYDYLSTHIRYPEQARESSIEGKVYIQFVVNENGSITGVEVVRSAGRSLDAEAVRVVSGMPKWKPGKVKGKPVKVYYKLPITFQLA